MNIELINTGSELMLGRVLNTHQQWICRQLADAGYTVTRQVAVPDTGADIGAAVREGLARADLVITTGGLGPTSDDLTRDEIAKLLGRQLREDAGTVEHIREFFTRRQRPMPERTRVQAMIPAGADVIPNAHGTAPGLWLAVEPNPHRDGGAGSVLVMLPGPPRELHPMFRGQVLPRLRATFPLAGGFACVTLKSTGLGESLMEELLEEPLRPFRERGLDLGFCARTGEVDVRLAANGGDATRLVAEAREVTLAAAGKHIFGDESESLEQVVVRRLTERGETVALAESCTGGYLANRITNVPGASAVLLAGLVTYSNAAKVKLLGVNVATLAEHGAVSEAVAREMAEGARARMNADFGIGITGIAGPSGGTEAKPVGTVYVALASAGGTRVSHRVNAFDRETFKFVTAQQALEMLRRAGLEAD